MLKSVKLRAEEQFAAIQKKDQTVPDEKEKALDEKAAQVARLRALRLAKEASDREAAEKAATGKAARGNGSAAARKPSPLPRGRRRAS